MNPTTGNPTPAAGPSSGKPPAPWPDPNFTKNTAKMSPAERQRWANRHVAWSWDGTRILAGSETREGVYEELKLLGIDPSTVVFGYVDDPDASNI